MNPFPEAKHSDALGQDMASKYSVFAIVVCSDHVLPLSPVVIIAAPIPPPTLPPWP
jgi:hypothetical protein